MSKKPTRKQLPVLSKISDGLFLGNKATGHKDTKGKYLAEVKVRTIINLHNTDNALKPFNVDEGDGGFRCKYFHFKVKANGGYSVNNFKLIISKIEEALRYGSVFLHCFASWERSPTFMIAFLMAKRSLSLDEACELVQEKHVHNLPVGEREKFKPRKQELEVFSRYLEGTFS